MRFDGRVDIGECADRAGNGTSGNLGPGGQEIENGSYGPDHGDGMNDVWHVVK